MYTRRNQKEQQEAGHSMQIIDSLAPMRSYKIFQEPGLAVHQCFTRDAIVTQSIFKLSAFLRKRKHDRIILYFVPANNNKTYSGFSAFDLDETKFGL